LDAAVVVCPRLTIWQLRWSACTDPSVCTDSTPGVDNDGDGPNEAQGDCNDGDPFVGPGAAEVCDLRDNDCDGEVDEGACPDPLDGCPLDFADVRCCGATHTIAGSFYEKGVEEARPMEVAIRRRSTGEVRRAVTCAGIQDGHDGFPYRFKLDDPVFVAPGEEYDLIIHLRWYFPAVLSSQACAILHPTVTTNGDTASACIDYGAFTLPCL
jgi:hypothetical protein